MGTIQARTASGTLYVINTDEKKVQRVFAGAELRRDGDWLTYYNEVKPVIGQNITFALEPLGYGDVTMRRTNVVTAITEGPSEG